MADRHNTESARRIDVLDKTDVHRFNLPKLRLSDEVLAALANAPENRRARQVGEWERLRRQTFRAAARPS